MTLTERVNLRLECFNAVKGMGHYQGEGKKREFIISDFDGRKDNAEDLFEWCIKEGDV